MNAFMQEFNFWTADASNLFIPVVASSALAFGFVTLAVIKNYMSLDAKDANGNLIDSSSPGYLMGYFKAFIVLLTIIPRIIFSLLGSLMAGMGFENLGAAMKSVFPDINKDGENTGVVDEAVQVATNWIF